MEVYQIFDVQKNRVHVHYFARLYIRVIVQCLSVIAHISNVVNSVTNISLKV